VTLAQDLDSADVAAVAEIARRRWQEYTGVRSFIVDTVTLVQNTIGNDWNTLAEFSLRVPVSA
jgi:hypothetical protein